MNYSLNKLTYEIIGAYRDFIKDTDSLDEREVHEWIHQVRAMLVRQKIQKSIYPIDNIYLQSFKSNLAFVDVSFDPSITIGDNILLTTIDIPRGIENTNELEYITKVSTLDRTERKFKFIPIELLSSAGKSRFDYSTVYVFRIGNKLGIYSRDDRYKTLQTIVIQGAFQNPVEAALLSDSNYTFDDLYPITISMATDIKNIIFKNYLKITINKPDDKVLDEEHNLTQQ